jgi:hypothetical protein
LSFLTSKLQDTKSRNILVEKIQVKILSNFSVKLIGGGSVLEPPKQKDRK